METIQLFLEKVNSVLWGWGMIILLIGTHIFLTIRLKFPQRYLFKAIKLSFSKEEGSKGDVSPFASLSTALAATVGIGNIIGVGTAVFLGGPGAVFWCWLTGVFGISTKYGEGLLAVKYRIQNTDGKMSGGPMYALEKGLHWKFMAILFAVFTAIATFGIGSTVQSNAISTILNSTYGISPHLIGIVIVIPVALTLIGGIKGISKVCTICVPFMVLVYIGSCFFILYLNSSYIFPAILLIVKSAFSWNAVGGGCFGGTLLIALRYGLSRGIFSNEAGLGSAPIVAATAQTKNPVRQALVSSTGTFWDTVVICALTGIVVVSSILAYPDISVENGEMFVKMSFSKIPYIGNMSLLFSLITFSFSTILGWYYYGERAMEYLSKKSFLQYIPTKYFIRLYRILYILSVYVGTIVPLNIVWSLSDTFNALMAFPNLLCLLFLSGVIVDETKKFLWNKNNDENKK